MTETAYRFGDFELYPSDRLLKRGDTPLSLQPKAFDALLCLVRKAQHLVSKEELTRALWPATHVSEANLTNIIVSLRKLLGRETVRTVSKHGYRLELPVTGEPGIERAVYERFVRARDLTSQRSLDHMQEARELLWTCLADDPGFAPAWAWLGRCCWFLDKFGRHSSGNTQLAHSALQRAFTLAPDLAEAHQFFTVLQVDTGDAAHASDRLLGRLQRFPDEPESLAGLVQAFRFQGLLRSSLDAHKRAVELDPTIATSVAHTLFAMGDYAASIEAYAGRAAYYLDAASWATLGLSDRALVLLRSRLQGSALSELMNALLQSLAAVLEGQPEEAIRWMETADTVREPEVLMYFARHYSYIDKADLAFATLQKAFEAGFVCAPETLKSDPWFAALRRSSGMERFVEQMESRTKTAQKALEPYKSVLKV